MHYLKIVSNGWQGFNGQLNIITFKDGVSTEPVPPRVADRIAASVRVVQCDAEGNEGEESVNVGIQHRLISEAASRAPVAKPLSLQTEADKKMEARLDAARSLTAPIDKLFTRVDLEKLADEQGIKGLRDVGKAWEITGRSIPEVIDKILAAQAEYIKLRNQKMDNAGGQVLKATTRATEDEPTLIVEVDDTPGVAGVAALPAEFKVGEVIIPQTTLCDLALKNSGKSLTGWNALEDDDRLLLVEKEIAALETHYGAKLEPVGSEEPQDDQPATEILLGSSVLASSYEIEGQTVTLGELVVAAKELSGKTAIEWNALPDADREDLIRCELDRRLPKEA
jgi:hypothetical protein